MKQLNECSCGCGGNGGCNDNDSNYMFFGNLKTIEEATCPTSIPSDSAASAAVLALSDKATI